MYSRRVELEDDHPWVPQKQEHQISLWNEKIRSSYFTRDFSLLTQMWTEKKGRWGSDKFSSIQTFLSNPDQHNEEGKLKQDSNTTTVVIYLHHAKKK